MLAKEVKGSAMLSVHLSLLACIMKDETTVSCYHTAVAYLA